MDKVLLKCRGISKRFSEVIAITGLDLDLNHGEIVSILGSSGCGKTTLLRLIAGLEKPDEGSIELEHKRLFGKDINVPPNKRGLGMVFQEYALFPHLSVRENILFGISTLSKKDQDTKLKKVLDLTRIGKLISRFPSELSGGEQQRVALARTLATEPSLLLMDEPFSNLDASLRGSVRNEVREILRDSGSTTLFVTHDREEAFSISDRVAIMVDGNIQQIDPPDKIYFWPNTKKVASLSGSCDFIGGITKGESIETSLGSIERRTHSMMENGTNVVVAVRPNDFVMTPDPKGNNVVIRKEFRGDDTLFWVKTRSGETIRCKHKIHTTLFVGLRVTLAPEKYVKFNAFLK